MTSSLKRPSLSKPKKGVKINLFDLTFVRARNKHKAHSLCLELFKESGLNKADLAKMLGKKPEQITRWLAGPGNMTLETLSDLIFALKGEFFVVKCKDDLSLGKSNRQGPEWLGQPTTKSSNWKEIAVESSISKQNNHSKSKAKYFFYIGTSQKEQKHEKYKTIRAKEIATVS